MGSGSCRRGRRRLARPEGHRLWLAVVAWALLAGLPTAPGASASTADRLRADIRHLAAAADRSTGSAGHQAAAAFIHRRLAAAGAAAVGEQRFMVPRRLGGQSRLESDAGRMPLAPLNLNAVTPPTVGAPGIEGPLVFAGAGSLSDFNGKPVEGAVVLMDFDSGGNWLNAAKLGARALIYVDDRFDDQSRFADKLELTPIAFPRFIVESRTVARLWDGWRTAPEGVVAPRVRLTGDAAWAPVETANIYALFPGSDPQLAPELVVVEAFYDSADGVMGLSPGADEASGIATLLELAQRLQNAPPRRSVLLVATGGHAQTLAGMRELIWLFGTDMDALEAAAGALKRAGEETAIHLATLDGAPEAVDPQAVAAALEDAVKSESDRLSRELMRLRLLPADGARQSRIQHLAQERWELRRLGWQRGIDPREPATRRLVDRLVPLARDRYRRLAADIDRQQERLDSSRRLKRLLREHTVKTVFSLHLSSHGDGIGAFNRGWLYDLKPDVNRIGPYGVLSETLQKAAGGAGSEPLRYVDALRPSRKQPWDSFFMDRPALGGEVSGIGGYVGVTLATLNDARPAWGTPADQPERVDVPALASQADLVWRLVHAAARGDRLDKGETPKTGFAVLQGRAMRLRHGELFADQPAPGTVVLAYQGAARYHVWVDGFGRFTLKGVADQKHVLDKVILEGYGFDPQSGEVQWAIDKERTDRDAYRVQMRRRHMETDLVLFGCRQLTIFDLLEPRTFNHMTKIKLLDARREAEPLRYWYSRIDTRNSTIASVYLEPGTRLKLTLSDTVRHRKLILTNASAEHPQGVGYRAGDTPAIYRSAYAIARDMWHLLHPRIANLERHGIFSEKIRGLQHDGRQALESAAEALAQRRYERFQAAATRSWALASRVYDQVEAVQKDVLMGVLFYIALFVPFAFCLERFLFGFTDIHRRILAFIGILVVLIFLIYRVHPAFQLAYSPMVVILAFFIIGLSLMVALIIFLRFEAAMVQLQRRARHLKATEIGRWQAFTAAFLLGVGNLRRRRMRTLLTCATLVILTFTIMSFTTVKSLRSHSRLPLEGRAPYTGFLFKVANWQSLPISAYDTLAAELAGVGRAAPRVWLENADRTRTTRVPLVRGAHRVDADGLVGLSAAEPQVSGLDRVLVGGRWFAPGARQAVLLSDRLARLLGIDPERPEGAIVRLWGVAHAVSGVFAADALEAAVDLDGEPMTPAVFPSEAALSLSEVEQNALEAGEDVEAFQTRYRHVPAELTVIVPAEALLAAGGKLKAVAVGMRRPAGGEALAGRLVDRFGLTLFTGERRGTALYQASETLSYGGVPNVVIPMLIAVLIVLNTMIGSVYERRREIGVYTSIGLAPSHVAFLFMAEAAAMAVLSTVCGYLLAQTAAKLMAGTALWAGLTVNYSSLAGVGAMALVMVVVLVSTLYPARVAARIAIPDVHRAWKMPQAQGNRMALRLPFLIQESEREGVGGFLLAHLQSHQDVTHGVFATGRIDVAMAPDARGVCRWLQSEVWLAPFDFGIMQKVDITFCPAETPGYLEIDVHIERQAGELRAWSRINQSFLHEIRKQLLLWRSLDEAGRDHYRRMLAAADAGLAPQGDAS